MRSSTALPLAGLALAALFAGLWLALAGEPEGVDAVVRNSEGAPATRESAPLVAAAQADEARSSVPGTRAANEPGGLGGRVIDSESGAGLAGFWATLHPDARAPDPDVAPLAEARTDAAGSFHIEGALEPRQWVRVEPEHGWLLETAALPVSTRPLVFRARRARRAPFHARLVDDETEEPLAYFRLGLRKLSDGTRFEVISDAEGLCTGDFDLLEGDLALEPVDDPRLRRVRMRWERARRVRHEALREARPVEVRLHAGPTYWLDLGLPAGLELESLHALLLEDERDSIGRRDDFTRTPVRLAPNDGSPWVRFGSFAPSAARGDAGRPLLLVVRDEARSQRGVAHVHPGAGVYPEVVSVTLAPMGRLAIATVDDSGAALAAARVSLARPGDGVVLARETTTSAGLVWFDGLPPGPYELRATHRRHEPATSELVVSAGLETSRTIELRAAQTSGVVAGRVVAGPRWRARKGAGGLEVTLRELGGTRRFGTSLSFEREGPERWVAAFRFEDVPTGRYVCALNNYETSSWWPQAIELMPPRADLLFAEIAAELSVRLQLEVRDAETAELLEDAMMFVSQEGTSVVTRAVNRRFGARVHRDVDLEWGVGAPGYVAQFGERGDLRLVAGELRATVELERGFGLRLEARTADAGPLAGARVLLDGREAGETGADGRLFVRAEASPEALLVEVEGRSTGSLADVAIERGWPHVVVYPDAR